MHVVMFSNYDRFELPLADAWRRALLSAGDTFTVAPQRVVAEQAIGDVAMVFGIAHQARPLLDLYRAAGKHWCLIDKGFTRPSILGKDAPRYWRISVDALFPTAALMWLRSDDSRWAQLGLRPQPMRRGGKHVLVCSTTHKSFRFQNLGDPLPYFQRVCRDLRELTDRPIRFRARQEEGGARLIGPLPGVEFADPAQPVAEDLKDAWVVVTHSSSVSLDALLAGIPVIELGEGVVKPIAETNLAKVDDPHCPTEDERQGWLNALAWHQFTLDEMAAGLARKVLLFHATEGRG